MERASEVLQGNARAVARQVLLSKYGQPTRFNPSGSASRVACPVPLSSPSVKGVGMEFLQSRLVRSGIKVDGIQGTRKAVRFVHPWPEGIDPRKTTAVETRVTTDVDASLDSPPQPVGRRRGRAADESLIRRSIRSNLDSRWKRSGSSRQRRQRRRKRTNGMFSSHRRGVAKSSKRTVNRPVMPSGAVVGAADALQPGVARGGSGLTNTGLIEGELRVRVPAFLPFDRVRSDERTDPVYALFDPAAAR
jgi:hypothetical protein